MLRNAIAVILFLILPACALAQTGIVGSSGPGGSAEYQALLDKYIRPIAAKGEPFDTRFDYEQIYVDDNIWRLHSSARLEALHARLLSAKPSAMSPAERLAWAINAYNFLVIERVTLNLLVPGHGFHRFTEVDGLYARQGGFFRTPIAAVEGRDYSLDTFQRRFVFGDTTSPGKPRAPLRDPRLLFATCPGRIGSPLLMPKAYRAETIEPQLDLATRTALALPRFLVAREKPPQLLVTDWLARNVADFGGSEPALLEFIRKYAPREVRETMRKAKLTQVGRYMAPNLKLNQVAHPKVIMTPGNVGALVSP